VGVRSPSSGQSEFVQTSMGQSEPGARVWLRLREGPDSGKLPQTRNSDKIQWNKNLRKLEIGAFGGRTAMYLWWEISDNQNPKLCASQLECEYP
jgi:hypothetical protein